MTKKRFSWAVGPLLMAGGLLAVAPKAHAGSYSVSVTGQGDCSATSGNQTGGWNCNGSFNDDCWSITSGNSGIGTTIKAKTQGTPTLWVRWWPGSAGETMPDSLSVLVTTRATAQGSHDVGGESSFTLSVSPGTGVDGKFPKSAWHCVSKVALTKQIVKVSTQGATKQSDGSYLIIKAIQMVTASASASVGRNPKKYDEEYGNYPDGANVNAEIGVLAQTDNRSVKLSRNSKDRFEVEDGKWTTYGDTTYSYNATVTEETTGGEGMTYYSTSEKPMVNTPEIRANFEGIWRQTTKVAQQGPHAGETYYGVGYQNEWSPSDAGDVTYYMDDSNHTFQYIKRQDMPFGSQSKQLNGLWKGTATGPQQKIITFTVKDPADDAAAKAKYVLNLHDEWENVILVNANAGQFKYWETFGTDLPPEGRAVSGPGVINVTYKALSPNDKLSIAALNVLVNFASAGIGEIPVAGWAGSALLDSAYGFVNFPTDETAPLVLESAEMWPMWQKAKDTYLNPSSPENSRPLAPGSPPEPVFIQAVNPADTPLVQAALTDAAQDQDQLWRNAIIIGVGRRTYMEKEARKIDHYTSDGFDGVKSFDVFKFTRDEKFGIFKTYLPNQQPPARGANAPMAPTEGDALQGAPMEQSSTGSANYASSATQRRLG